MHLFYSTEIDGNQIVLDETESKHAVRVLRLGVGAGVRVLDGSGGLYSAEISLPDPKHCRLTITGLQKEFGKRNFNLHLSLIHISFIPSSKPGIMRLSSSSSTNSIFPSGKLGLSKDVSNNLPSMR